MVFSSTTFLFMFLPVCLLVYFLPIFRNNTSKDISYKNFILCVVSLFFYAWGEPIYIVLMLISIYFNFNIGKDLAKHEDEMLQRKLILVFALAFNLALLSFFKYYDFLVQNMNTWFDLNLQQKELPLPIGISFYTFQIISYVVDVYRKDVRAQKKLTSFACYVSLFPQLIAGPIVQYSQIDKQLEQRTINMQKFSAGIIFFIRGLGKKVIFANTLGALYTQMNAPTDEISVLASWFAIICYTLQIFFDFSGYSDMAIGLGKMFGFEFMQNFNFPYVATSITDFWRRWHISLSSWFKNYVYIPLGGSRKGKVRTVLNLLIVWSLTGFWHGASWNFVTWGFYYAILLILEKFVFAKIIDKTPKILRHISTLILVMVGWVFFSSPNLTEAVNYLSVMFATSTNPLVSGDIVYQITTNFFPVLIASLSAFNFFANLPKTKNPRLNIVLQFALYIVIFIICIIFLISDTYNPFLYFRF